MLAALLGFANVLGAGILAGEEFIVRYGVRAPIATLEPKPQIQLRQALIRRMRVVIPAVFVFTLLSGAGAAWLGPRFDPGFGIRFAGLLALVAFIAITLAGTVPINKAALGWNPAAPPADWRAAIARWERLDTARTWAALAAFGLFLAAATLR